MIPKGVKNRIFQATPEGDRINCHMSLALFSTATGYYREEAAGVEGAVLPVLIHSTTKKNAKKDLQTTAENRIDLYNANLSHEEDVEPRFLRGLERFGGLDLKVCVSKNGSMTKELFLEVVNYFINQLPKHLGAGNQFSFLLLDGHVSRWHPVALFLLFKHNIIPVFFPSHTLIDCRKASRQRRDLLSAQVH